MNTAGVARQYCGRLGKAANCQAGMFLAYVSPLGKALVDKQLCLPESWIQTPIAVRRRVYRSKTELALEMVERALELGHIRAEWVAGDEAFGMSPPFRPFDKLRRLGGLGDALSAGRPGRHHRMAAGA